MELSLLKNMIVTQLFEKFSTINGTRRLLTEFTQACDWNPS